MGIELKTKTGNITLTAPKVVSGGSVDLSNYYTKAQTDAKIQEVVDAIPEVDLSDYATVDYVDSTVDKLADFDYVNDKVREYQGVTEKWADEKFATKSDIPDVSGFQTAEQVQGIVTDALAEIGVAEEGEY